jgi:hypothetical protein
VAGKLVACWKQFDKLDDDNEWKVTSIIQKTKTQSKSPTWYVHFIIV